jgi:hypothetical protein
MFEALDSIPKTAKKKKKKQLRENWLSTCRRLKQHPYLPICIKINSKWIQDLNIKLETLK